MVVETQVTVKVVKHIPIRLCKVVFNGGYHLVVGGRFVCMRTAGGVRNYPDMPEYRMEDFPVDTEKYFDGCFTKDDVQVLVQDKAGQMKPVGPVRACALLFNARGADTVRQWIRQEAAK